MKCLLQSLLMLLPLCLLGQTEPTLQEVLANLDFDEVTSGILWDASPQLIDLELLDGQSIHDSNRMTINTYGLAYATIFGGCLEEEVLPPTPDVYMNAAENVIPNGVIPITISAFRYHKMDEDGLDDGLFSYTNGLLYDVPNRPRNPYLEKTTFFASSVINMTADATTSFQIPSALYLSNFTETISQIEIDLGDGTGFQTVIFDQVVTASYSDLTESKEIEIRFTYSNGATIRAHFVFGILTIPESNLSVESRYDDEPSTTIEVNGGVGQLFSVCEDGATEIRKPFIFVEGFNPDLEALGFSNQTFIHMQRQLEFIAGGNTLLGHLENEDYDLIYVDFDDPTASIQDNAAVVQAIIEEINNQKAINGSLQKNVIFGESMGGLVGKYALLNMENNGVDHETELLMTFDSPLRGANVPLSIQQFADDMFTFQIPLFEEPVGQVFLLGDFVGLVNEAGLALYDPEVQQMLINCIHHNGPVNAHDALMAEIDAFGPPENFKMFAISNGSNAGVSQNKLDEVTPLLAGDRMIRIEVGNHDLDDIYLDFKENLFGSTIQGYILSNADFLENFLSDLIPIFSNNKEEFVVNMYAMKTIPNEKIYDFRQTHYLFRSIPIVKRKSELYSDPSRFNLIPIDNAPGGISIGGVDDRLLNLQDLGLADIDAYNFCFVPTVSALDMIPPNDLNMFFDVSMELPTIDAELTVVDRYSASPGIVFPFTQENQEHVSFSSVNAGLFLFALSSGNIAPNFINGTIYNFGEADDSQPFTIPFKKTKNTIERSIAMINGGELWVNRLDKIGFINNTNNADNGNPTHFDLFTHSDLCDEEVDDILIRVADDGKIVLGEWEAPTGNTANLYLGNKVTLRVENGGLLDIDQNSKLIIQSGAEVIIEGGGLLDCSWNAQVIVEAGGILRVENNGQLRPWNNGKIWVQPGGQLILNGGAQVQLWAGSGPDAIEDAPCNIKLGGPITDPDNTPDVAELVLDGQFEYSGTGYFDFHRNANIELVGDTDFAIDGYAKGYRFLKLSDGAHLNIDKNECHLRNGEVEYTESSQIDLTKDAAGRFSQVEFTGHPNSTAIDADGARFVFIGGSNFSNFEMGISARLLTDYYLNENVFIFESDFSNCKRGVNAEGLDNIRIWNTEMNLTDSDLIGSGEGVHLEIVNNCYLTNSRIGNYNTGLEIWGATDFVMNGGNIHDNRIGIFLQDDIEDDVELALTNSTVDLIGKATLENNLMGIFGVAGDYIPNEGPYPMITLDCARLIENVIGIRGRDLLLNMDGGSETAPNILIENPDFNKSKILEFCYYKLDLGGTDISATNNYWGESPPNVYSYIKQENGEIELTDFCTMWPDDGYDDFTTVNVGSGNVDLDFSDFLEEEPTGCGSPGTPTGGGGNDDKVYTPLEPTDEYHRKAAECLAPNERAIYEDYWQAYALYLSEVERSTADHSASRDAFSPIAKLGEDKKAEYSGFCRMLIEKARSRAGNNIYRSSASQYTNVYKVDRASVYPNPTEHRLYVKTEKNLFSNYQIVDVMGEMWQKGSIEADAVETKIEVSDLPPGVYMIQLEGKATHWKTIRFVVSE